MRAACVAVAVPDSLRIAAASQHRGHGPVCRAQSPNSPASGRPMSQWWPKGSTSRPAAAHTAGQRWARSAWRRWRWHARRPRRVRDPQVEPHRRAVKRLRTEIRCFRRLVRDSKAGTSDRHFRDDPADGVRVPVNLLRAKPPLDKVHRQHCIRHGQDWSDHAPENLHCRSVSQRPRRDVLLPLLNLPDQQVRNPGRSVGPTDSNCRPAAALATLAGRPPGDPLGVRSSGSPLCQGPWRGLFYAGFGGSGK